MITDRDISKLGTIFATKEDLKNFVTKDDAEKFATKETLADVRVELGELRERVDVMDGKIDTILVKMDTFVGTAYELREDSAAGAQILYRHETNIRALADGTGITLPEE